MKRLSRFIALFCGVTSSLFLVIDVADVLIGAASRQFAASLTWTEEAARISLVWCVMIGASSAFYEGDNMTVDFMVRILPDKLKRFCNVLSFMIEAIVLGVLIYYGAQNVMGGWTMRTMALHIPRAVPLMAVPFGMSLFLAVLIAKFLTRDTGD